MGTKRKIPGYATDVTTDLALRFLEQQPAAQPWALVYQHKAPHRPFLPPPRFAKLYENTEIPYPATFDDDYATRKIAREAEDMRFDVSLAGDYKDMPSGLSGGERKKWIYQRFVKDYYGAIAAVDENLGKVLAHLDRTGQTRDTLIIYTSDNGFFVGDHGWYDKRFMYEPSLRVPTLIQAPGSAAGRVVDSMIMNIDIAPTILDYAGVRVPGTMQGRSLRPLLEGSVPADWRKSVYYSYYENSWVLAGKGLEARSDPGFQFFTPHRIGPHRGVRTATHKLIHYYSDGEYRELFDLTSDPNELRNLWDTPEAASVQPGLVEELSRLQREFKDV